MCQRISYRGKAISNQGELKSVTGLKALPFLPGGRTDLKVDGDNVCLCPVDVEEVARRIGVFCEYDSAWGYDFQEIDRS